METSRLLLLDATALEKNNPTGVEQYARQLLPHLTRTLQQDKWLIGWVGHGEQPPSSIPEGTHWYCSPHTRFWGQTALPRLLGLLNPALYFTPSSIPPLRAHCATACTVHDLGVYHQPSSYSLADRFRLGTLSKRAGRGATSIIVPTQYVAHDVQHFWHIKQDRITVAGEGYNGNSETVQPLSITNPFILFVGRIEKKKNLLPLLQGFEKLVLEQDCRLVLAGGDGVGASTIKKQIKKLPFQVQQKIDMPGYVTEGQKQWLYENAALGVIPCPYEGFGLPLLDCFAAGIPAVCAKAGALPEVGGNACQYSEYDSPTDWYLQMRYILDDASLRKQLSASGKDRLSDFSWEKTAITVASALAKAATARR